MFPLKERGSTLSYLEILQQWSPEFFEMFAEDDIRRMLKQKAAFVLLIRHETR